MFLLKLFRKKISAHKAQGSPTTPGRAKDILAFIIALYQLFLPLVIALVITGALAVLILSVFFIRF